MITVTAKCMKHPKYKAVQRPRADCGACWELFYLRIAAKLHDSAENVEVVVI